MSYPVVVANLSVGFATFVHIGIITQGVLWVFDHSEYINPLIKGISWVLDKTLLVVLTALGTFLGKRIDDWWQERDSSSGE